MSDANLFDRRPPNEPVPVDVTPEPLDITPGNGFGPGFAMDEETAPAGPMSRRRMLVLGTALVVGLAGAAALGTFGWRIAQQKDARLTPPAQLAGLTLDNSARAQETADYLRTGFAADIDLDQSFGVVYADPAEPERAVLLFGGTTLIWQPERDLDRLLQLVADDSGEISGLREVPAGDFGGVLKCGAIAGEGDFAVCGWADHGSIAMAMFPGRGVDDSATLMREIRSNVQHRD